MEHTNKNAVKILASEYSDYYKNTWHYDRQYNMLCRMEKAVLPQADVIKSVCEHNYFVADSNNNLLQCRKCGQVGQKQTVL